MPLVAFPTRTVGSRRRPSVRSPGFRMRMRSFAHMPRSATSREVARVHAHPVLPSAVTKASASRLIISRLNGWPMHSPADASSPASRPETHGPGPVRIATPSPQWTCATYSLPVSRRTADHNPAGRRPRAGPSRDGRNRRKIRSDAGATLRVRVLRHAAREPPDYRQLDRHLLAYDVAIERLSVYFVRSYCAATSFITIRNSISCPGDEIPVDWLAHCPFGGSHFFQCH